MCILISLKLMKRKTNKVYEEPAGIDIRFWKALARGQAWHNFNLPFCLSTCRIIITIYTCRHPLISIPEPGRISKLFFSSRLFEIVKLLTKVNNEVGIIGNALFFLRMLSMCKHVYSSLWHKVCSACDLHEITH